MNGTSEIIDLGSSYHVLKVTERNEYSISEDDIIDRLVSIKAEEEMKNILNEIDENITNLTIQEISDIYGISFKSEERLSITDLLTSFGDLDFVEDFERNNIFLNEVYGPYELDQGYLITSDFIKKQNDILLFTHRFTRPANDLVGEDTHFRYCTETNTKLLLKKE